MPCRAVSRALAAGAFLAGLVAQGRGGNVLGASQPPAPERFAILSQSAEVDPVRRQVEFTLRFNQAPDLFTVDEFNRPAKSFQYEVNSDYTGARFEDALASLRAVVRADEFRVAGKLRVRNANTQPDPDPIAGGWGGIRGAVPVDIRPIDGDGVVLRFTAGYDLLKETDGVFAYRVFTTEFGETTSRVEARVVPLPPAVWGGAATLVAALVAAATTSIKPPICIRPRRPIT